MLQNTLKKASLFLTAITLTIITFAQDKKVDISIGTEPKSSNIMSQPWVWIVGGAVFILLLVALIRGGKKD